MKISFTVPVHLAGLLSPEVDAGARGGRPRSVPIEAASWTDVANDLRTRFPSLAERVLDESDGVRPGFALILNDEVLQEGCTGVDLREGDEITLLPIMAGGA
jgi:molybdopterin converting factor small subunit